jgi:hypothetical protein
MPSGVYVHFLIHGNDEYTEGYGYVPEDDLEAAKSNPDHPIPCTVDKWVVLGKHVEEFLGPGNYVVYITSDEIEL